MKHIIICCDGGLGNRLNGLLTGLIVADLIKRQPIICWPKNNYCDCLFTDLFENNEFKIIDLPHNEVLVDNQENVFLTHLGTINNIAQDLVYGYDYKSLQILENVNKTVITTSDKIPKIFDKSLAIKVLNSLKIKKEILTKTKLVCFEQNIDHHSLGLHVRNTDNANLPDVDLIYTNIKNSNRSYFICSDNENTEKHLAGLPNVKIHKKNHYVKKFTDGEWRTSFVDSEGRQGIYNVNRSLESVKEAFIDMLILSRTNIVSNKGSTFLDCAKIFSRIDIFKDIKWKKY